MSTAQPNREGVITLVINPEQADYLRRLVLEDVAKEAEQVHESAARAASDIDNAGWCGDAQTGLRLMTEGTDMLDMLGWHGGSVDPGV